jgi:hypothetical protein
MSVFDTIAICVPHGVAFTSYSESVVVPAKAAVALSDVLKRVVALCDVTHSQHFRVL